MKISACLQPLFYDSFPFLRRNPAHAFIIQHNNAGIFFRTSPGTFYFIHVSSADRSDFFQHIYYSVYRGNPNLLIHSDSFIINFLYSWSISFSKMMSMSANLCFVILHPCSFNLCKSSLLCISHHSPVRLPYLLICTDYFFSLVSIF